MKKQKNNEINFKALLLIGIIIMLAGLFSLPRNVDFGAAMIMGGFVLSLISILKLSKNKKIRRVMASAWWFLAAGIIFGFAGIRYFFRGDVVGGLINIFVSILFFAAFIGHSIKKG
jgi:hypothetical protein